MSENYWSGLAKRRLGRRQAVALFGATTAGAAFLAACGGGNSSPGTGSGGTSSLIAKAVDSTAQAKRGGLMKDRHPFGDPATFDIFTANLPLNPICSHVYNSLVQVKPGYMKPTENELVPDLAESWEWSPDGLQVTLKVRQDAKWHNKSPVNGRPLDIDDILFTWNRFITKHTSRAAVSNAVDAQAPVLSLTATDSKTLVLKLKEPLVYGLGLFASNFSQGMVIIPRETDTTFDIRSDAIGTGPYVMANYSPSVGFTLKRHPDTYEKNDVLVDQVDLPIIREYATAVSQLKAGNIYSMGSHATSPGVTAEDILSVKSEEPRLSVYQGDFGTAGSIGNRFAFGWLPPGKSPFLDERVRQAISMGIDRDLYADTFFNISKFGSQGLPVNMRWHTALAATNEGWWLDPKGKDFGPNSKYFEHNPAEAKKLLAAAGYANGFPVTSHYVTTQELGTTVKHAEVIDGMMQDLGITVKVEPVDYLRDYAPNYRDGRGQWEGWTFKSTAGGVTAPEAIATLANEYWSKAGVSFHGFSTSGQNDMSGDPQVNSLIERARRELDTEKRKALVFDLQRYLAKAWFAVPLPATATGFTVAWPSLANFRVYQGARNNYRLWIDDSKPPFKSA